MVEGNDRSTYDIITVDWNPEQTRIWRHYVEKNCPTANIITIPDNKPIPWNWSSGKIDCFKYEFSHPGRVVYMDTDVIVTGDVEPWVDETQRQGCDMSASTLLPKVGKPKNWFHRFPEITEKACSLFDVDRFPRHFSTGFMVFIDYDFDGLHEGWMRSMELPKFREMLQKTLVYEEFAFSLWIESQDDKVLDMPLEIHGNLLGNVKYFGTCTNENPPLVLHYHKPPRLIKAGLKGFLNV